MGGVKDTQVGTYMYLPESVRDDLAYQFKLTSTEYERELGEEWKRIDTGTHSCLSWD